MFIDRSSNLYKGLSTLRCSINLILKSVVRHHYYCPSVRLPQVYISKTVRKSV